MTEPTTDTIIPLRLSDPPRVLLLLTVSDPAVTLPRHPRLIRPVTADASRRAYVSETAAQYVARSSVLPWQGSK